MNQIKTILTHLRPHLDEIAGIYQLRNWGNGRFQGVQDACIKFLTTSRLPNNVRPKTLEKKGILPLGVGGGLLDEHPSLIGKRKHGECAATLVAHALRIDHDQTLMKILAEVTHCDTTNLVKPTQLASLVKLRHRQNPDNAEKVIAWAMIAIDALYKQGAQQISRVIDRGEVRLIFTELTTAHNWGHTEALKQVQNAIAKSDGEAHLSLTELAHLYKVLKGVSGVCSAEDWVREVIVDMYNDSQMFFEAVKVLSTSEVVEIHTPRCRLPLAIVHSDNEHVSNASRSSWGGCNAVTIQRNSKGNVYISLNTRHKTIREMKFDTRTMLDDMVCMLRSREAKRRGRHNPGTWENLSRDGVVKVAPVWYYPKGNGIILNGSVTTPDVKPTRLTISEIVEIAQHAFHPALVRQWQEKNNIYLEQKREVKIADEVCEAEPHAVVEVSHASLPSSEEVEDELEKLMVTSCG